MFPQLHEREEVEDEKQEGEIMALFFSFFLLASPMAEVYTDYILGGNPRAL